MPAAWGEAFAHFTVQQNGAPIRVLVQSSTAGVANFSNLAVGDFAVFRHYSDRDVSIDGTCTTLFGSFTFDAEADEGWNIVTFDVTQVVGGVPVGVVVRDVAEVPTGAEWFFVAPPAQ